VIRTAILASGFGSNLQVMIDQKNSGDLAIDIVAVISDQANAFALNRARAANIPAILIDHRDYQSRNAFDAQLGKILEEREIELIILAGFMRILSRKLVDQYAWKILNIHPSLLPKYKGLDTHKRVLLSDDLYHGATVHFVTAELDAGPIIIQMQFPIFPNDTETQLQMQVHKCEYIIYPQAVQWFANGELTVENELVLRQGKSCYVAPYFMKR